MRIVTVDARCRCRSASCARHALGVVNRTASPMPRITIMMSTTTSLGFSRSRMRAVRIVKSDVAIACHWTPLLLRWCRRRPSCAPTVIARLSEAVDAHDVVEHPARLPQVVELWTTTAAIDQDALWGQHPARVAKGPDACRVRRCRRVPLGHSRAAQAS